MKKGIFSFAGLLLAAAVCVNAHATPLATQLEQTAASWVKRSGDAQSARLAHLRFYFPKNKTQALGEGEACFVRGVAFYLFNMYISTAVYGQDMPARLTLDYAGVLDGLMMCKVNPGFDTRKVVAFYNEHHNEIKAYLKEFFAAGHLPAYDVADAVNTRRERAFLQVLAASPRREQQPAYNGEAGRTRSASNAAETAALKKLLQESLDGAKGKVVLYENTQLAPQVMDSPHATHGTKTVRTYRCVEDECAACSYILGQNACAQLNAQDASRWVRIYTITAHPVSGFYLTPASGARFTQADGTAADRWQYHTALWVVMYTEGKYSTYIVDKFLAGAAPVSVSAWTQKFAPNKTVFTLSPYVRQAASEAQIRPADTSHGSVIEVEGKLYQPAEITR